MSAPSIAVLLSVERGLAGGALLRSAGLVEVASGVCNGSLGACAYLLACLSCLLVFPAKLTLHSLDIVRLAQEARQRWAGRAPGARMGAWTLWEQSSCAPRCALTNAFHSTSYSSHACMTSCKTAAVKGQQPARTTPYFQHPAPVTSLEGRRRPGEQRPA